MMLKLAADENFNGRIVRGIRRRHPEVDLIRIQDLGLGGTADTEVLDRCAAEGRLLLTHDRSTVPRYAYERVVSEQPMPGIMLCDEDIPISKAIDDIALLALCSEDGEWENQVIYLPL